MRLNFLKVRCKLAIAYAPRERITNPEIAEESNAPEVNDI